MTVIKIKDADGASVYLSGSGAGTSGDPFTTALPSGAATAANQLTDFHLEVSKGNVSGHSKVNKFGHNPAATSGDDVWGGTGVYAFYPTTAQTVQAVSSSTADVATTGTGAWTMEVYGLDSNWEEQNETVTLNGTTPVVLTNTYIRMFRAIVLTAGTGETNAGNITVAVSGGDTAIYINIGDGQTQHAIYTTPAGKTAYFLKGYVGLADDDRTGEAVEFQWKARPNTVANGAWAVKGEMGLVTLASSNWQYLYGVPSGPIPGKTDIKIQVSSATTTLGVVGGFDLILVDD